MKSRIKVLIIGLVFICLAGFYAVIDKAVSIYDTEYDTSEFQSITLEEGKTLSQTFVCAEEYIDGISLKIAADNVSDNKQAVIAYELIDVQSGASVVKSEFNLDGLSSGKFLKVKFDRVSDSRNNEYTLKLSLAECPEGSVRLFYTPGTGADTELNYGGDNVDGIAVVRTLTHGFDLETFVVTLCFMAYIILFMRWLYKLFK